jgi:hypothetical protein
MEIETRQRPINSKVLESNHVKRQIEILKKAIEEAQEEMDYEAAHDKEVMKAIRVVEEFLRKSGRVCYGGQAINAHLPTKLRFYNEEYDVPDFDFFTPNAEKDINDLVLALQKEGFTDISEKAGVHEGTRKIYVNFVAIADVTSLPLDLYKKYAKNSISVAGVRYVNEDILRMMMFLELSRPRGEVERWMKVFERLTLLNTAKPIQRCSERTPRINNIPPKVRQKLLEYLIQEKRVLAGAEIGFIYRSYADPTPPRMTWFLYSGGPLLFFSPNLEKDTEAIKEILGPKGLTIQRKEGYSDYIPTRIVIRKNRQIVAYLIDETSCNSYNDIPIENGGNVRIASLETLIYIYLMLGLMTDETKTLGVSLLCLAQRYVELLNKMRLSKYSRFPLFSIKCSGHQKSIRSLVRERALRAEKEKKRNKTSKKRNGKYGSKGKQSSRNTTHKNKNQQQK